jgi:hypothetical protein
MKSKLFKFALVGIILCSISVKGFTPPLPPGTTVCIDGIPSCYEAKVVLGESTVVHMLPRTREWFLTSETCSWNNGSHDYNIQIYTKATSSSPFILVASISSADAYTTNHVDDYLYFIEFHWDQLVPPQPAPE